MGNREQSSPSSPQDKALEIISATVLGRKRAEDAVAELRHEGLDALDVLVGVLAEASKKSTSSVRAQAAIQLQRFSERSAPDAAARTVHRVPHVPVLVNGTLYDPPDIRRFDGVELHFVPADDHLLAIDDRSVIANLWQTSYLSSALESYQYGGYDTGVGPQIVIPTVPMEPGGELPPYNPGGSSGEGGSGTLLFEHVNFDGDWLTLPKNKAYYDLTEVGKDFLGLGDWNDVISSVQMYTTTMCVLFEHVHRGGASLTLHGGTENLVAWGWNDRVSSVETW